MRVLFLGDHAATGFGTVTRDLGIGLLDRGLDVRFLSQNQLKQLPEPFYSRTINALTLSNSEQIPALLEGTSDLLLANDEVVGSWKPDAVILLGDFAAARIVVGQYLEAFRRHGHLFHYVPIEGVDLPPALNALWDVFSPVAMSQFGADEIAKVTGTRPPVVYHGVNIDAFYPVSPERPIHIDGAEPITLTSKLDCKRMWGVFFGGRVPKNWILRTDRHMPRKRYDAMIRALIPVLARRRDTALVIHGRIFDQGGYLPDAISKIPTAECLTARCLCLGTTRHASDAYIDPDLGHAYRIAPDRGPQILLTEASDLDRSILNSLYNAADLYASISAEGFGLTIAEALATGIPAVGLDYSAVPEVIGPAGYTVPVAYLYDNEYSHKWAAIDEAKFAYRVEQLIANDSKRLALGAKGPAHISSSFNWSTAADQFAALLRSAVSPQEVAA